MNYKTKSMVTIAVLVVFMGMVGVFINNLEEGITGAVVAPACKCTSDADCNDGNSCTADICLYADECKAALCINTQIAGCS